MVFGDVEFYFIITYCILFLFGFIMNIMSLYQLIRERVKMKIHSRMNLLLINLAVADLVVCQKTIFIFIGFGTIPGYPVSTANRNCLDLHCVLGVIRINVQTNGFPQDGWLLPLWLHHDGHIHWQTHGYYVPHGTQVTMKTVLNTSSPTNIQTEEAKDTCDAGGCLGVSSPLHPSSDLQLPPDPPLRPS